MIKLFFTCLLVATFNANAIEMLSYKNTGSSLTVLSETAVTQAWNSQTPACIKEGGKILGVNKAFRDANFKYGDCSTSDAKKRIHKALGKEVIVMKLSELPESLIKEIKGAK